MCARAGIKTSKKRSQHHIKVRMRDISTRLAWQLNVADIEPDPFQVAGVYIMWHCERTLIFLALNRQSCRMLLYTRRVCLAPALHREAEIGYISSFGNWVETDS